MLHAHSALRFLVLGLGSIGLVVFGLGQLQNKPFSKGARVIGSVFAGLTHLQAVLGLGVVIGGVWYPRLIGHLVMMLAAAVVLQVFLTLNRRKPTPGHLFPLLGTALALLLMVGGTFAIGRHPFEATVFGSTPAAPSTP